LTEANFSAILFLLVMPFYINSCITGRIFMNKTSQRVAVLIDTQNMYHSAKHIHGARLAFGKTVEAVAEGRPVVRAIAYVAKSKTGEENAFFEAMTEMGIELKIKDIQEFSSGAKKADWDVGIAVDAVKLAEKVDVIILLTGDGDFVPLVEYLHGRGVIVEVAAFGESTNAQLKEVVDHFFDISEHHDLLIGSRLARGHKGHRGEATFGLPNELDEVSKKSTSPQKGKPTRESPKRVRVTY
jgi:uncharacterized LabA/DUF88 family protein